MFPILDSRGNVIGFGGRVIGEGEPKYLNSPETPLFEKGRELYGLWQARRAIRDANLVIVVEGYMDVVALAQHGVENAVATLGTATTPDPRREAPAAGRQRRLLLRRRQRRAQGGLEGARGVAARAGRRQVGRLPVPARRGRPRHLRAPPAARRRSSAALARGEAPVPVPASPRSPPRWTWAPRRAAPASSRRRSRSWPRSRRRPWAP